MNNCVNFHLHFVLIVLTSYIFLGKFFCLDHFSIASNLQKSATLQEKDVTEYTGISDDAQTIQSTEVYSEQQLFNCYFLLTEI